MGRRRKATAADLVEQVLPPESGLRQWVLTFPFSWRRRLAQDAGLLGRLTRIVVKTVLRFCAARAAQEGRLGVTRGAVTVVQRMSSDLRLNPHLHLVVLYGAWSEDGGELAWEGLSHLGTSEVGEVVERLVRRIERHLRRCGLLGTFGDEPEGESDPEPRRFGVMGPGAAGRASVGESPRPPRDALAYDKPLCASLDGFTLHAATRAGAFHLAGREALLRYVLRPPGRAGAAEAGP
jgi:putative transposase